MEQVWLQKRKWNGAKYWKPYRVDFYDKDRVRLMDDKGCVQLDCSSRFLQTLYVHGYLSRYKPVKGE